MERILIAGATGLLGGRIARSLLAQKRAVRALVRERSRALELEQLGAELAIGDLTDPASLNAACNGVTHVISTANAFLQKGTNTPDRVDVAGTGALANAARDANVRRFVYVSAVVAEPNSDVDFYRYKYEAQEAVRASGVSYTIVRPPAYMDVWAEIVLAKTRSGGPAMIFGDGKQPINFISIEDLTRIIISVMDDSAAENQVIDLAGPENLTLLEFVEKYERHVGHPVKRRHIPVGAMRIMRRVVRPFNPVLSRMMSGGLHLATQSPTFNAPRKPDFQLMTFEQWLTRSGRSQ